MCLALKYIENIKFKILISFLLCTKICYTQITVHYINVNNQNLTLKKNNTYKTVELAKKAVTEQLVNWQSQGYITASVDSIVEKKDSILNYIYLGKKYKWKTLYLNDSIENVVKTIIPLFKNEEIVPLYKQINLPDTILQHCKNNGHPFATVQFTNIKINNGEIIGTLVLEKNIQYKIDSIRLLGNLKIDRTVLTKIIGIENGMLYNENTLNNINTKLNKLNYLEQFKQWDITLLANSSIVNIYANKKNRNKLDAIVGFLPNNQQTGGSLLFTVDAKLHLENAFAKGEIIDLNWQQIQPQSPRVDINYNKPFFLKSNVGLIIDFNLYKRDSAFLNVQGKIGVNYPINVKSSIDIYFSNISTRVIEPDTLFVIANKKLPSVQDVSIQKIGLNYYLNTTNTKLIPTKGYYIVIQTTAGLKTIEKNNSFVNIKTGNFNYNKLYDTLQLNDYQLKIVAAISSYKSIGKLSALKTSIQAGFLQTNRFLTNELFQIGGFKLLRGFDEENIFTNAYAVASAEYRYIFGERSYFFGFTDFGIAQNKNLNQTNNYLGFGGGMALETKQGILQVSLALGKENNSPINFREAKIHIGIVNNF